MESKISADEKAYLAERLTEMGATVILDKAKPSRKKLEFMQLAVICMVVASFVFTAFSYILAWFDKNPVESLSIAIIDAMWATTGVFGGTYGVQNCVRAWSQNQFVNSKTEYINYTEIQTGGENRGKL